MAQQLSDGNGSVILGQTGDTVTIVGTISATASALSVESVTASGAVTVGGAFEANDDATIGGASASIGFFGATPSAQAALTLGAAITAGHQTTTTLAAAFVELYDEVIAKGLAATA